MIKISYPISISSIYKMHPKISFKNACRSNGLHVTLQKADVFHQILKAKHQAGQRQLVKFLSTKHCSWDQSYLHVNGCRCHRKHLWLWGGLPKQSDCKRKILHQKNWVTLRTGVTEVKWNSKAKIKHSETENKNFSIKLRSSARGNWGGELHVYINWIQNYLSCQSAISNERETQYQRHGRINTISAEDWQYLTWTILHNYCISCSRRMNSSWSHCRDGLFNWSLKQRAWHMRIKWKIMIQFLQNMWTGMMDYKCIKGEINYLR